MIIDTHVHVWWPGDGHLVLIRERIAQLNAEFRFEQLLPDLGKAGVDKVILVSAAQSFAETQRLLAVADQFKERVAGVIGYLDLDANGFAGRLDDAASHFALSGLRLPLVTIDDPYWICRPRVRAALAILSARGLIAQVLAAPVHLAICADVLADFPDLKVIVDHAGNPGAGPPFDTTWLTGLEAVAQRTNALCKIGEFSIAAGPLADDERSVAILRHVVSCFGTQRLLFGSNWPVSALRLPYGDVLRRLLATARHIGISPEDVVEAVTRNAVLIYSGRTAAAP